MNRRKNVKQIISIVCLIALCLSTATISDAVDADVEQWAFENGVIFTEASSSDPDLWGVCGYDESRNKVGNITIESSYPYLPKSKQIIAIMHYKADDGTITGAFEKKILPAVKITSGTDGYPISSRSFFGSTIQGDFLFQDYKNARIGASSFSNTTFNSNVTFRLDNAVLYENVFKDSTVAGNMNILGSIDTIKAYAFSDLVVKGDFYMPGIIANMESYALANSHFTEYYLSDSLQTIGSHIFDGCKYLKKIRLPHTDCVKTAAPDAFPNEKGMTILIPEGLTDLSVFHLENYPNVLFQTETELPPDSPVLQYLKEHNLMYQQGEDGEIIMPEDPVQTAPPSAAPTAAPTGQPTSAPTDTPAAQSTSAPTDTPAAQPTSAPTTTPATQPSATPTQTPASTPAIIPTGQPDAASTDTPATQPSAAPTTTPATQPASTPTAAPAKKRVPTAITIKKIKYRIIGKNKATVLGSTDKKLKKLRIPDTVTINGTLYKVVQIEKKAFKKQNKLKSAVIGNYVTKIGNEAFASCRNLEIVQFGTRLQTLGRKVLYNDKKLKRITFKGEQLKKIGNKTFSGVPLEVNIRVVRSKAKSYSKLINRSKT